MRWKLRVAKSVALISLSILFFACGGGSGDSGGGSTPTVAFTLSWNAPATDEGGGALTGLSGYNVYYGTSPRTGDDPKMCGMCGYTQKVNIPNAGATSHVLNLASGTYYFAVTAYDDSGNESLFTSQVTHSK